MENQMLFWARFSDITAVPPHKQLKSQQRTAEVF